MSNKQLIQLECFMHKGTFTVEIDLRKGQKIGNFAICGDCINQMHEELNQEKDIQK